MKILEMIPAILCCASPSVELLGVRTHEGHGTPGFQTRTHDTTVFKQD